MKLIVVSVIAVLYLMWPTSARADPTDKAKALKLYAQGRKLFDQKKYRAAIGKFKQARRFWKHRSLLFNIAAAHAHLKEPVAAVTYLRLYLKQAKPSERNVPEFLKKMQQQVGILVVQVLHRKAAIRVDGLLRGYGRVELVMKPGSKKVVILVGHKVVARRDVQLLAGRKVLWEVSEIPAAVIKPGIRVRPRRRVPTLAPPPPRRRRPAGVVPPKGEPAQKRSGRTVWKALFGATVGVGAALLIAAIGTGFKTQDLEGEKTALVKETFFTTNPVDGPDACQDAGEKGYTDIVDVCNRGRMFAMATNVLIGTGAALVAGSMYFMYRAFFARVKVDKKTAETKEKSSRFPVTVTPALGPGGASLSVSLDF